MLTDDGILGIASLVLDNVRCITHLILHCASSIADGVLGIASCTLDVIAHRLQADTKLFNAVEFSAARE